MTQHNDERTGALEVALRRYIAKNRTAIDRVIHDRIPGIKSKDIDDAERRLWVLNDSDLYSIAVTAGFGLGD